MSEIDEDALFISETRPASRPKGAFLLLHGMESHSGWFVDTTARLVESGYAVVAYDRPGWGRSPGAPGHLDSYRQFVEQTTAIASRLREDYDAVHLAGMSWGGMAALYLGLRCGWLFDSIALLAPGIATLQDIPFTHKCRVLKQILTGTTDARVTPLFRPEDFTRDAEWRDFIQNDPARRRTVTASFCLETLKMRRCIRELAGKRLLPPALCLLAGADRIVDNDATAAVCRQAGAVVETLPGCAHTLIFEAPAQTAAVLARHADNAVREGAPSGTEGGRAWIAGGGAVGGTLASLLSFGGVETGLLVKPGRADALRRDGFTLSRGMAARTARERLTFAETQDGLPPRPHLVILAVKGFDTDAALSGLAGHIGPDTVVASVQNGVRNEERLAKAFPGNTIIAASICAGLEVTAPGQVRWADDRGGLGAALHRGDATTAKAVWLSLMPRTGMECRWYGGPDAARRLKWSKLMLNTGFNALNSVTGLTSEGILADEQYGELALSALREGFLAMERMDLYPFDLPGFPVAKLRLLVKAPSTLARRILSWQTGRTPEAAFSMRQDMLKQRQQTEIAELNGEIVDAGRKFAFPAPANRELVKMVSERQKNA